MSISINVVRALYERMNRGSAIPIHMQLDVGHWCSYEQKGKDGDLNCWLRELGPISPIFHLQQMDGKNDVRWSFSKKNNARGVIKMDQVLETLDSAGCKEAYWFPEIGFPYEKDEEALLVEMDEEHRLPQFVPVKPPRLICALGRVVAAGGGATFPG